MMTFLEEEKSLRKKALKAEWYQKNKEKVIARSAEWRKNNVEKARRTKALYRLKRSELKEKKKELPEDTKECSRCKEEKHISGFHKDSSAKSGIRSYCKACSSAGMKKWYSNNKEAAKRLRDAWVEANQEKIKAYSAAYYAENKEKNKRRASVWAAKNSDRRRETNKAWREANPEKIRVSHLNRRVRKRLYVGVLSKDIAKKLFSLQKGKCACCGKPLNDDYHLDHIMPLALGGKNEDGNIQLLRASCNQQKHAKHPVDFMQSRGFLL